MNFANFDSWPIRQRLPLSLMVLLLAGCASTTEEQDAEPRKLTDCFGISIGTGIRIGYGSLGVTLGQERCRERQQEQEAAKAGEEEKPEAPSEADAEQNPSSAPAQ